MQVVPTRHQETEIADLLANRDAFNKRIYTPWEEALAEMEARQNNEALRTYVAAQLPEGLPASMQGKKSLVLFRHVATPNHEVARFAMCADALNTFNPLVLEYTQDKFNDRNEWKYYMGKLRFHKGINSKGEPMFEQIVVMNFNESNNKPISSIKTHWGQSLVDFHHELFAHAYPSLKDNRADVSEWLKHLGPSAKEYYKAFFSMFLQDGVLFENFLMDGKEMKFTEEVILPAILELEAETGFKPLIVALEPTGIEGDHFWLSHPYSTKALVEAKKGG